MERKRQQDNTEIEKEMRITTTKRKKTTNTRPLTAMNKNRRKRYHYICQQNQIHKMARIPNKNTQHIHNNTYYHIPL